MDSKQDCEIRIKRKDQKDQKGRRDKDALVDTVEVSLSKKPIPSLMKPIPSLMKPIPSLMKPIPSLIKTPLITTVPRELRKSSPATRLELIDQEEFKKSMRLLAISRRSKSEANKL